MKMEVSTWALRILPGAAGLPPSPGLAARNTQWALCQRMTRTAKSGRFLLSALLPIHTWALMVSLAKKKKEVKDPLTPVNNILLTCFSSYGQLLSVNLIVLCYLAMLYISLPKIYPLPSPAHIHTQFQLFPVVLM